MEEVSVIELVQQGYTSFTEQQKRFFDAIEIAPQKWALSPWGDKDGGFWAIGIIGRTVLWYNHIERGFNISAYREYNRIDEYWCSQSSLSEAVLSMKHAADTGLAPVQAGPPISRR
ncbi:MAG: hypothetical protein AAGH38_02670 [Pseudomonadota bacterium]